MYYAFEQRHSSLAGYLMSEIEVSIVSDTDKMEFTKIFAKWDTGASHTVISTRLQKQLGLAPISSELITGVGGTQQADVVKLTIKLPNDVSITSRRIGVCNISSAQNNDMLIGMDIIQLGDFHIVNTDGKTVFSFVIPPLPNPKSITAEVDKLNQHEKR
jgi:predicted aspartyl protease